MPGNINHSNIHIAYCIRCTAVVVMSKQEYMRMSTSSGPMTWSACEAMLAPLSARNWQPLMTANCGVSRRLCWIAFDKYNWRDLIQEL